MDIEMTNATSLLSSPNEASNSNNYGSGDKEGRGNENETPVTNQISPSPMATGAQAKETGARSPLDEDLVQRLHHMKKAPPHMRNISMRVSSPSDALSPFSQKLMAADRLKGVQPKSLSSFLTRTGAALTRHSGSEVEDSGPEMMINPGHSQEIIMRRISPMRDDHGLMEAFMKDDESTGMNSTSASLDDDETPIPPSPTRHIGAK